MSAALGRLGVGTLGDNMRAEASPRQMSRHARWPRARMVMLAVLAGAIVFVHRPTTASAAAEIAAAELGGCTATGREVRVTVHVAGHGVTEVWIVEVIGAEEVDIGYANFVSPDPFPAGGFDVVISAVLPFGTHQLDWYDRGPSGVRYGPHRASYPSFIIDVVTCVGPAGSTDPTTTIGPPPDTPSTTTTGPPPPDTPTTTTGPPPPETPSSTTTTGPKKPPPSDESTTTAGPGPSDSGPSDGPDTTPGPMPPPDGPDPASTTMPPRPDPPMCRAPDRVTLEQGDPIVRVGRRGRIVVQIAFTVADIPGSSTIAAALSNAPDRVGPPCRTTTAIRYSPDYFTGPGSEGPTNHDIPGSGDLTRDWVLVPKRVGTTTVQVFVGDVPYVLDISISSDDLEVPPPIDGPEIPIWGWPLFGICTGLVVLRRRPRPGPPGGPPLITDPPHHPPPGDHASSNRFFVPAKGESIEEPLPPPPVKPPKPKPRARLETSEDTVVVAAASSDPIALRLQVSTTRITDTWRGKPT